MEKENKLVYVDDQGNEILCEILFTFDSDVFSKSYVLFYPVGGDDESIEVFAASYKPLEDGSVGELSEIETEEEWKLVKETLDSFSSEEGCGCCEGDCDDECGDEGCEHCEHEEE